jgi:hypothetical protein
MAAHKFTSKAQWRYLHARFGHKGFVKRWSEKQEGAPYKALPKRKRARKR